MSKCQGWCRMAFTSHATGRQYRSGRVSKWCGATEPHTSHDHYSQSAGRYVHCDGSE